MFVGCWWLCRFFGWQVRAVGDFSLAARACWRFLVGCQGVLAAPCWRLGFVGMRSRSLFKSMVCSRTGRLGEGTQRALKLEAPQSLDFWTISDFGLLIFWFSGLLVFGFARFFI